jgi:hypothetical protein
MPLYTRTFSDVVDEVVTQSGRLDRRTAIIQYVNQTVREVELSKFFAKNLVELSLTTTAEPHIWSFPANFRRLQAVKYPQALEQWPKFRTPGPAQRDLEYYYYSAGRYFMFEGLGIGDPIALAYHQFSNILGYYAATGNVRPARWEEEGQDWSYLSSGSYVSTLGSTALDEAAQALVTNWVIYDHFQMVVEGTLAKLFKSIKDLERSSLSYSLYKTLWDAMKEDELTASEAQ